MKANRNKIMKKKLSYVICTPPYDENIGGVIVLYELGRLLHSLGQRVVMAPSYCYNNYANSDSKVASLCKRVVRYKRIQQHIAEVKACNPFPVPLFDLRKHFFSFLPRQKSWVAVYPEIMSGNPYVAQQVVRYLLNNPGEINGRPEQYGENELLFRYGSWFAENYVPNKGSVVSKHMITLYHTPECYHLPEQAVQRHGTAYCIRKGAGKPIVHDLTDSVCIDGMSHTQIADIFRRVETFISYDPYTAYSRFAVLCGCRSVVITDDSTARQSDMIAYTDGSDLTGSTIDWERAYQQAVSELNAEQLSNLRNVKYFIADCEAFF